MQDVIEYLRANPHASVKETRVRFGIAKNRLFAIRKDLGLAGSWVPPEIRSAIEARLAINPLEKPVDLQRDFGVTAMVITRIRRKLELVGLPGIHRAEVLGEAEAFLGANPQARTALVAESFGLTEKSVTGLRSGLELPRMTCVVEARARSQRRRELGVPRREDRPALCGVTAPVPVKKSERWRRLQAPFEKYFVSSFGRVRIGEVGALVMQHQNIRGYWVLSLADPSGKQYIKRTHRLVAEAFIPNPEGKPEVNHDDGDTSNPHVKNLEWMTKAENMEHASRTGLFTSVISPGVVRAICRSLSDRRAAGKSLSVIAGEHGVPVTLVERISARRTWTAISTGYEWEAEDARDPEFAGRAKLSAGDVRAICAKFSEGLGDQSMASLAAEYQVPPSVVYKISARKTWKHVSCEYLW